jgi:hypothetical protein
VTGKKKVCEELALNETRDLDLGKDLPFYCKVPLGLRIPPLLIKLKFMSSEKPTIF